MEAARGRDIPEDILRDIKGTSLDKGVELDALAKLAPPQRQAVIERAKAGEQVTARRLPWEPPQRSIQIPDREDQRKCAGGVN